MKNQILFGLFGDYRLFGDCQSFFKLIYLGSRRLFPVDNFARVEVDVERNVVAEVFSRHDVRHVTIIRADFFAIFQKVRAEHVRALR